MLKCRVYLFILAYFIFSLKAWGLQNHVVNEKSQGRVILVSGSCSSGKSSMAKIIAQKLNAKSFAFDEYVMPIVLNKFIQKHYGKILAFFISGFVMRNFFTTVGFLSEKRKYEFEQKFYADLKSGMADEPITKMLKEVKDLAMQGRDVVVESPISLFGGVEFTAQLAALNDVNVSYVMAYCPWDCIVDRIQRRNSSKNKKVHRELEWALINFIDNVKLSHQNNGALFLERVNGNNVHKVIKEYAKPEYTKKRMHLGTQMQSLASKKFAQNTNYYIYPRFKYNVIVNTKTNTPEQCAEHVLRYIQKKSKQA